MRDVPYRQQQQVTDAQFSAHLRLPGAAGQALDDARARDNVQAQIRAVAQHFRFRSAPGWFYYMHGTPWHETDAPGKVLDKAEGLLRGTYVNSWPRHERIQLGAGPVHDWKTALGQAGCATGRHTFVTELSTAFALTGRSEFALKAMELMSSFVKACPFVLDERFFEDHDAYFGGEGQHTLTVTYRLFRMTDFLYCGAPQAPGLLSDEDVFWLVKQLWFLSMQFFRLVGDALRRDNHHLVDHGHIAFCMGVMFPEFDFSKEFAAEGARVIRHHFGQNLMPDGGYAEHSAGYQYHIFYHFLHPLGVAQAAGVTLFSGKQIESLRKWLNFNARLCQPNGWIPPIGDETGRMFTHLFGALATPALNPQLAAMARALGFEPGKPVYATAEKIGKRMETWQEGTPPKVGLTPYYLSGGQVGKPDAKALPQPASAHFPYGGYTFFRNEWSPKADYFALSHFSKHLFGGHAHWDMLSFILHTQGQRLIGDPATWLYTDDRFFKHGDSDSVALDDLKQMHRGYSYSVNAHNCLTLNDDTLKPLAAMCHGTFWGGHPPPHECGLFQAGGPIEIAEVWHDANAPWRHRRFVVHLVGLGFVLVDIVDKKALDLRPNQWSQGFHFEFDVEIDAENPPQGAALNAKLDGASCLIVPGRDMESKWRAFRDAYLTQVYALNRRSYGTGPWVAELIRRVRGPAVFTTFILTHGAQGLPRAPEPRYLGATPCASFGWQKDAVSAHALDLGPHGRVLLAACPFKKPLENAELSTDAELAVVLQDANGKTKAWAAARASRLAIGGKPVFKGKKSEWRAS